MNYIIFEGNKYKLVPLNKIGIKRLESKIIFYSSCEKDKFKKFIEENPMDYFIDNKIYDEMYIKKYKFFEYLIYFKKGYLILDSPIKLRQLTEVGDKYYAIDEEIYKMMKEISGGEINFKTEIDDFPFREKNLKNICKKKGCGVKVGEEEYCGKHLILKSLKKWLHQRYLSEFEWNEKIEIFIF